MTLSGIGSEARTVFVSEPRKRIGDLHMIQERPFITNLCFYGPTAARPPRYEYGAVQLSTRAFYERHAFCFKLTNWNKYDRILLYLLRTIPRQWHYCAVHVRGLVALQALPAACQPGQGAVLASHSPERFIPVVLSHWPSTRPPTHLSALPCSSCSS